MPLPPYALLILLSLLPILFPLSIPFLSKISADMSDFFAKLSIVSNCVILVTSTPIDDNFCNRFINLSIVSCSISSPISLFNSTKFPITPLISNGPNFSFFAFPFFPAPVLSTFSGNSICHKFILLPISIISFISSICLSFKSLKSLCKYALYLF